MNESLIMNAKNGNLEMVKFQLDRGADIDYKYNKALYLAAKYGHLEVFNYLLDESELDAKDNRTLRIWAETGNIEMVKTLVRYDVVNDNNCKALCGAIKGGHTEVAKILFEEYFNIYDEREKIIFLSAEYGNLEILKLIIDRFNSFDCEIIKMAACNGHYAVVKYLIDRIGEYDNHNCTAYMDALELSVENGHIEIVKMLIKVCHETHKREELRISAVKNRLDIFTLLVDCGATIHHKNDQLLIFCVINNRPEFVSLLLKKGAKVNTHTHMSLEISVERDYQDIIKILLLHYEIEELKKALLINKIKKIILTKMVNWNLSEYSILIQAFREIGIDIFDLIENEKIDN